MSLWLRVRGAQTVLAAVVVTLLGVALPVSVVAATPSPAGATLAAACILALVVPVAVGWGCGRGDSQLESTSLRPIRTFDLMFAALAVGGTCLAILLMYQLGVAPAGLIAVRAMLVYTGIILMTYPLAGWRVATIMPAIYLLAVVLFGRGVDIAHPARWAWIAADGHEPVSWILSLVLLGAGVVVYLALPARTAGVRAED